METICKDGAHELDFCVAVGPPGWNDPRVGLSPAAVENRTSGACVSTAARAGTPPKSRAEVNPRPEKPGLALIRGFSPAGKAVDTMKTEVEPEVRNLLHSGVLIVDALLARQHDLAKMAQQWMREVATLGGNVDAEPLHWTGGRELQAPFTLFGVIYRAVVEPDGRELRLETLTPTEDGEAWSLLARGFWDGLHVELHGPGDSGDVLAPSCTMALRETLRLLEQEGGQR